MRARRFLLVMGWAVGMLLGAALFRQPALGSLLGLAAGTAGGGGPDRSGKP